jgi:hypothetical protein
LAIAAFANTSLEAHLSSGFHRIEVTVRYFFNLAGVVDAPDNTGLEISSLSEARIHAVKFASEYLRDRPELVWLGEEFRVEVTDERRELVFTFIAVGVDAPAQEGRLRI